jgi:hypothetical protein
MIVSKWRLCQQTQYLVDKKEVFSNIPLRGCPAGSKGARKSINRQILLKE